MSKIGLKRMIVQEEGYTLSEDKLTLTLLLAKCYDVIITFNLKGNPNKHIQSKTIRHDIRAVFELSEDMSWNDELVLSELVNTGKASIPRKNESEAYWVLDDVWNYFERIAPKGYHFGATDENGNCIGWHKDNEKAAVTEHETAELVITQ